MKLFADLIQEIDSTTEIIPKVSALVHYFETADNADKLWAIALLSGKRPKRNITTTLMREWASEQSKLPLWLFEDSYHVVGDLAEAAALLLPEPNKYSEQSLDYWIRSLIALKEKEEPEKKAFILSAWDQLNRHERFAFNKLITGGMRISVTQKLITKALAKHTGQNENTIAYKLMGTWDPLETSFERLVLSEDDAADLFKPYPFYPIYGLDVESLKLGDISEWQIERKWDGIRVQLIFRNGEMHIWTSEQEMVKDQYPELHSLSDSIPDGTTLDCELICHDGECPLPYSFLLKRIGKTKVSKKLKLDAPVCAIVYDILEYNGKDISATTLVSRTLLLEQILTQANHDSILMSEKLTLSSWEAAISTNQESRRLQSDGLLLRKICSLYQPNDGEWWKWKSDALTIDAVMIYASTEAGFRSKVFSQYTFAVWDDGLLVPFTKAFIGLTEEEHSRVHAFVKVNTVERFGPVRSIKPVLVFELAFDHIQLSNRHKSGIVVRFPRIQEWKEDKPAKEASTLDDLKKLLEEYG